jgi:hypothetical protein
MNQAIFITGLNNWGKTRIIQNLFLGQTRFSYGSPYSIPGINAQFTVEPNSNDDYSGNTWVQHIDNRMRAAHPDAQNLFTSLCPSMEEGNHFVDLLRKPVFGDFNVLHLFIIKYKWDHSAKLIIQNIAREVCTLPNVKIIRINADTDETNEELRLQAKLKQINTQLVKIFDRQLIKAS